MISLLKKRLPKSKVIGATIFMAIQVMTTLYLPTLTSNIVNNGVAKGECSLYLDGRHSNDDLLTDQCCGRSV